MIIGVERNPKRSEQQEVVIFQSSFEIFSSVSVNCESWKEKEKRRIVGEKTEKNQPARARGCGKAERFNKEKCRSARATKQYQQRQAVQGLSGGREASRETSSLLLFFIIKWLTAV